MRDTNNKASWIVYAAYAHADYERGDIISRHKTYEAARAAAKRSGYDSFRAIGMMP